MIVNVNQLREAIAIINMVNSVPLEEIRWNIPNVGDISVDPKDIEEWKYIGLNNRDFFLEVIENREWWEKKRGYREAMWGETIMPETLTQDEITELLVAVNTTMDDIAKSSEDTGYTQNQHRVLRCIQDLTAISIRLETGRDTSFELMTIARSLTQVLHDLERDNE